LIAHIRRLEEKGEPEKREGFGSTCSERLGILERVREDLRRLRGKSKEEITRELGARVAYIKLDRFNQFLNKTTTSRRRSRHKGQCSRASD
jgi:hypothetical protein